MLLCGALRSEHERKSLLVMQRKRTSDVWRKMTDRWHHHQMFAANIIEWDQTHTLSLLMCCVKITTAFPWHSCQKSRT